MVGRRESSRAKVRPTRPVPLPSSKTRSDGCGVVEETDEKKEGRKVDGEEQMRRERRGAEPQVRKPVVLDRRVVSRIVREIGGVDGGA